jgi:hypothetical protein
MGSRAYQPVGAFRETPLRDILACSHRSFTWPVPRGIPPVGSYPTLSPITCAVWKRNMLRLYRPSAGLLSVALDVAAGLRRRRPSGCWPERPLLRVRTLLYILENSRTQRRVGRPRPALDYTAVGQALGCRRRAREPLRLRRTILVGVRRSSTLSVSLQRFCQRGSSPTAGSNQTPGPSSSITPS